MNNLNIKVQKSTSLKDIRRKSLYKVLYVRIIDVKLIRAIKIFDAVGLE